MSRERLAQSLPVVGIGSLPTYQPESRSGHGSLPSGTIAALQKALATTKDTRSLVVQDRDVLTRLGSISGAVEQIRFFDRQGHAEFFEREVRWTASGIPDRTVWMCGPWITLVGQWALRLAAKPWVMDLMRWSGSRAWGARPLMSCGQRPQWCW
ncbi:MAG: hypothetical protein IPH60_15225 [Flavobacteriales bacterium]|nr:hypothetical protein [Flavobacteriales bacterium]